MIKGTASVEKMSARINMYAVRSMYYVRSRFNPRLTGVSAERH